MKNNYRVVYSADHISHANSDFLREDNEASTRLIDRTIGYLRSDLGTPDEWRRRLKEWPAQMLSNTRSRILALLNKAWDDSSMKRLGAASFSEFQEMFLNRLRGAGYDCYELINNPVKLTYRKQKAGNRESKRMSMYRAVIGKKRAAMQ